ncbi:hypothetical protein [uncultured Pseudacidovorax sp.]|uniref:hypothetical protein n=1 Tax=uncultured Pseudacidovorax sp. TaxID=679313 RepID=UPI0025FADEFF|nr:hypothetical protein [uncultured Pseudacidovorax sp.]
MWRASFDRAARLLLVMTWLLLVGVAPVRAERLDDSSSPRARVPAMLDLGAREPGTPYAWVTFRGVEYRLATAAYAGRRARIYHVVPAFVSGLRSPAGLLVEWSGGGAFAAGSAMAGERRLVWAGVVPGPWLVERLDLRLRLDLREWRPVGGRPFDVESYFDIEVMP